MIASWMGYALVVGLLVSLAAFAAERALLLGRKPVRRVWAGALVLSLLIPTLSPLLPWHLPVPPLPALTSIPDPSPGPAEIGVRDGVPVPMVSVAEPGWGMNKVLLTVWVASSGVLALFLVYAMGVLQGRRKEWRRASVDGVPVLLSRDVGPAVIGWRRLDIVLPEWVHDLAEPARALILRHEIEHVNRQDPRLLLRGFLVVVAMPWNPAVWFQLGRLRRAIELDCDARVVASGADRAHYGRVLLEAIGRCNRGGLPAFAAFAERSADLEARIDALTATRSGFWRGRALAAATAATVLAVAACLMPDSLAPGRATQPGHQLETSRAGMEWVRERLKGHPPADIVILYRSPEGRFLGTEILKSPERGARPVRVGAALMPDLDKSLAKSIESVEVIRGPTLAVPGIDGVIVITLKAGAVIGAKAGDESRAKSQSIIGMLDFAAVVAGPRFGGPFASVSYLWYETDASGALRGAGYASGRSALRSRNGRRPIQSGMVSRGGRVPSEMHWARYEVP